MHLNVPASSLFSASVCSARLSLTWFVWTRSTDDYLCEEREENVVVCVHSVSKQFNGPWRSTWVVARYCRPEIPPPPPPPPPPSSPVTTTRTHAPSPCLAGTLVACSPDRTLFLLLVLLVLLVPRHFQVQGKEARRPGRGASAGRERWSWVCERSEGEDGQGVGGRRERGGRGGRGRAGV